MKSVPTFRPLAAILAAALAFGAAAATADEKPSPVKVTWTNPDEFSEVKHNPGYGLGSEKPELWLGELSKYLQRRAARIVAPGQQLDVTFTDIQRAGTFEPWRGPRWDEVRIIKDIYPPRIDLKFTLTDANGGVVREGTAKLRDPAFLQRGILNETDPLRFEKRMLDDWLRKEFPAAGRS